MTKKGPKITDPEARRSPGLLEDPRTEQVYDATVRKHPDGRWVMCHRENKATFSTNHAAHCASTWLKDIGYLLQPYHCPQTGTDHYHLTSMGFTRLAHRNAARRRTERADWHLVLPPAAR